MIEPLNRTLYAQLIRAFDGHVKISHEGEGMRWTATRDNLNDGRERIELVPGCAGEYYLVNCPYCNDTRQRLWVHHAFGSRLPEGRKGRWLWTAICYNEHCLDSPANREDFHERVFGHMNRDQLGKIKVTPGVLEKDVLEYAEAPGSVVPITWLPVDHPAREYLTGRGCDVQRLWDLFRVQYCVQAHPRYSRCTGRIVIPVWMDGKYVGWQGRHVGTADWRQVPKYYNLPGMPKRLSLYNWDNASQQRLVVLTEGAPAVWAIGHHATAVLGKTLSPSHLLRLGEWSARTQGLLLLVLDREAREQAQELLPTLSRIVLDRAVNVLLPDDRDPADLESGFFWDLCRVAARERGFQLEDFVDERSALSGF